MAMDHPGTEELVRQLSVGFEALQDEYQKLFGQHQALERKLSTAREQYNELSKLCGSGKITTPPLSLASSNGRLQQETTVTQTASEILASTQSGTAKEAADRVEAAQEAVRQLKKGLLRSTKDAGEGVKIWAGPAADKPDAGSSMLPSISESPLEQDFTIEGKPSRLGCPFASMANKKLSSHAASVLSRYDQGSVGAGSTSLSAASRVNGKEFLARRASRRASIADPIKAEICGLSDHDAESPLSERALKSQTEGQQNVEAGVCPIRFLDQHSPEEVATYFERHKHELPRSHEVCVKRYQSNEKQIQELDAKYGNLVSMIQGLGAKHKDMLPKDPEDGDDEDEVNAEEETKSAEKVRKWASSVSVQAADLQSGEDNEEPRQPHFERPLRDIRLGESPSRPWGIQIPAKYLDDARSEASSSPVQVASPPLGTAAVEPVARAATQKAAKCPFGFDQVAERPRPEPPGKAAVPLADAAPAEPASKPAAFEPEPPEQPTVREEQAGSPSQVVFNGPVFIGYSANDAAKFLREAQLIAK